MSGEFEIRVAEGRYSLRAVKPGLSFSTADFSYEDPRHLQIEPGGCTQVEFVGRNGIDK